MIKVDFNNVKDCSSGKYGNYKEIQLLPQIGLIYWFPTKKDKSFIYGIYFVWIFWNILFYTERNT